jgi:hypothetical protein
MLAIDLWLYVRPGGATRESEKYWMGRMRVVWCQIRSSELITPACVDWGPIIWPRWIRLIMYWRIHNLWGPTNLVASTIAELDDTLLYFSGDIGIVWRPPTDARWRITWKTGIRVRWAWLNSLIVIVNCDHSWCLCGSRVSCCQVIILQGYIDSNLRDTLGYGRCVFAVVNM